MTRTCQFVSDDLKSCTLKNVAKPVDEPAAKALDALRLAGRPPQGGSHAPTSTLIISITALLVAVLGSTPLGRAAYASVVPRNSVGTVQLKRNAVTASKIAPNAIRTGQIVDSSLLTADSKPGQIPHGAEGGQGGHRYNRHPGRE